MAEGWILACGWAEVMQGLIQTVVGNTSFSFVTEGGRYIANNGGDCRRRKDSIMMLTLDAFLEDWIHDCHRGPA